MNNNLNFEAVKGYHLNLRKLNDDQTKFITENLIKDYRDFEGDNNLFHYGFSSPNNEYRFFNFTCFSSGQISEEISFDYYMDKLNFHKPEHDPKDVAFKPTAKFYIFNNEKEDYEEIAHSTKEKFLEFKEPKTIIGYKLIKPEYKEAVRAITGFKGFSFNCFEKEGVERMEWSVDTLKTAGVMYWFEEVYEKESITLKSGVTLSEDDIAEVKEILNNK